MTYKTHALPGGDRDREIAIERCRMAPILEGHAVEIDTALLDIGWLRPIAILDANRGELHVDELLHVVYCALQVAHVLADVAEVSLQHEERGQHECYVASVRDAL